MLVLLEKREAGLVKVDGQGAVDGVTGGVFAGCTVGGIGPNFFT